MKSRYEVCIWRGASWMAVLTVFMLMFMVGYCSNSSTILSIRFLDSSRVQYFKVPAADLWTKLTAQSSAYLIQIRGKVSSVLNRHDLTVIPESVKLEQGLARARAAIRKASLQNLSSNRSIYRNPSAFYQSYVEMEKRFKVYVYEEGDLPIVHDGPCKDLYTIEGRFIHEMERGKGRRFRTRDGHKAHVHFMPFSVAWMVEYLYKPLTYDVTPLTDFVSDYIKVISTRHSFWNRSQGADHFMAACHDWGPKASKGNPLLFNTSIRVVCNANVTEGFNPQKDVTLPEVDLHDGNIPPRFRSPSTPTNRPHLAFFAGGLHGSIRPLLLKHWKGRDRNIQVFEYLPENLDYYTFMLNSKFCLCPSGSEVASPRITESIYSECVPVIISDHYILPFSDVLRWEAFSIQVEVSDIPRLKEILSAVTEDEYLKMKEGLRAVKKHFWLDKPAKRFDVFHMILHSIWLRRLNLNLP